MKVTFRDDDVSLFKCPEDLQKAYDLVASNYSIDQKTISVIEETEMNYSGMNNWQDKDLSLFYIIDFIKKRRCWIIIRNQYPGILKYGKHKESVAYTLDHYDRFVYDCKRCKKKNVLHVIYTNYWQLNQEAKVKKRLEKIYDYVVKDRTQFISLSDCFR